MRRNIAVWVIVLCVAGVAAGDDATAPSQPPSEIPGQTPGQGQTPTPGQAPTPSPTPAPSPTPGQGGWQGRHAAMWQAAQSACAKAKAGTACSFQGRHAMHQGTCQMMNQVLACVSNDKQGGMPGQSGLFGQGGMGWGGGRHY